MNIATFLFQILLLIPFAAIPFFWGMDDGLMKKNKTEAHWPKYPIFISIAYSVIYSFFIGFYARNLQEGLICMSALLAGWVLIWKPLFDKGWTKGRGMKGIHLGEYWLDRLFYRITSNGRFIYMLYAFMVVGGLFLMRHFNY